MVFEINIKISQYNRTCSIIFLTISTILSDYQYNWEV